MERIIVVMDSGNKAVILPLFFVAFRTVRGVGNRVPVPPFAGRGCGLEVDCAAAKRLAPSLLCGWYTGGVASWWSGILEERGVFSGRRLACVYKRCGGETDGACSDERRPQREDGARVLAAVGPLLLFFSCLTTLLSRARGCPKARCAEVSSLGVGDFGTLCALCCEGSFLFTGSCMRSRRMTRSVTTRTLVGL